MPDQNPNKRKKMILLVVALFVVLATGIFYYFSTPHIPPITDDEPYSTLTCTGANARSALLEVLDTYDKTGDSAAFAVANSKIKSGVCSYSTDDNYYWWQPDTAPEGFEDYETEECRTVSNGHCIAVQRMYQLDENFEEIIGSGYMLIETRVTGSYDFEKSPAFRHQKGLIFDMNY